MEEECSRTFGTTELGILRTASWMIPVQKYSNPSVATFRKHPPGRFLIVFSRMVHKKTAHWKLCKFVSFGQIGLAPAVYVEAQAAQTMILLTYVNLYPYHSRQRHWRCQARFENLDEFGCYLCFFFTEFYDQRNDMVPSEVE